MSQVIRVKGARTHNLKNLDLTIPRDKLVVITGPSGSGKSSLAFDTLYAEGQRRYVESLSAYARQFLSMMDKPDVDQIEGLSPAIAIEQKSTSHNPRSTVGTMTEIYDYFRLLFARVGTPYCPTHNLPLEAQTLPQMVQRLCELNEGIKLMILAPLVQNRKGEHSDALASLKQQGYLRVRIDNAIHMTDELPTLDANVHHSIEAVVDRLKLKKDNTLRLTESLQTALDLGQGMAQVLLMDSPDAPPILLSAKHACPKCGHSVPLLEPKHFSFNNPSGACDTCDGLGIQRLFTEDKMVPDMALSLAEGAIQSWGPKRTYYYHQLEQLADFYDFDLQTPYADLPENIRQILMHGSKRDKPILRESFRRRRRTSIPQHKRFEGVLPYMTRRYEETDSEAVREQMVELLTYTDCQSCQGSRLNTNARHVKVGKHALPKLVDMPLDALITLLEKMKLGTQKRLIAESILQEIKSRLSFLCNVGLNYLNLHRPTETLSGGEAQRIRLASQIGSGLVGVMYVLDEPSIGLHQRDNQRLLDTLIHLRDLGNTVIVVEHDEEAMLQADHILDIGPKAGVHGGQLVAEGSPKAIMNNPASVTGAYLSGKKTITLPKKRQPYDPKKVIRITGANCNNLKNVDVSLPIGLLTCITGVSGSGKSSLINHTLYPHVLHALARTGNAQKGQVKSIAGLGHLDKVIAIDQKPIGRTPRSNPATYTGLFTPIRELFAQTEEARSRGYKPGHFSFNVTGGRCEACHGDGVIRVEMHFLADVYVVCEQCEGSRYQRNTLDVLYKGKNIHEVLSMTMEEAYTFFEAIPNIANKCKTLMDVGLGYIQLGQSATTLSGGEAQRIKLSRELAKRNTGKTLYILDEPTTGLHFEDIQLLLKVLHRLRDLGNTILVIEHNLDVIKTADWIVDVGPEGGQGGGTIVGFGTPEDLCKNKDSHTAHFLKLMLGDKA